MADLATIADAIVSELNDASEAGSFNRTFEARVLWAKRKTQLEENDVLRVDVAPINQTRSLFSRGRHLIQLRYHVAVRKRFVKAERDQGGAISDVEVKDLTVLLDALMEFFYPKQPGACGRPLTAYQDVTVLAPVGDLSIDTIIRWEDLEGMSQFTGYFPLTMQAVE